MPNYEFFCHGCKKAFSKILDEAEYAEGSIPCPHCGSDDVEQRWFYTTTTRKSA
jgi:putative FmdB family regulatory protein